MRAVRSRGGIRRRVIGWLSVALLTCGCGGEESAGEGEGPGAAESTQEAGASLLEEAREAIEKRRWSSAMEKVESALELNPKVEGGEALREQIQTEMDNLERIKQAQALFDSRAYLEAYRKLAPVGTESVYFDWAFWEGIQIRHALNLPESTVRRGEMRMHRVLLGEYLRGSTRKDVSRAVKLCKETTPQSECKRSSFEDALRKKNDEKFGGKVYVDSFYMDETEVSVEHYELCVVEGGCTAVDWAACDINEASQRKVNQPDLPQVCVSWQDAQSYCEWAGGRLPTEAEWEKAAAGPENRDFPWGDLWRPKAANWADGKGRVDGYEGLAPVHAYGAHGYGLFNMAGNAMEWVYDWYDEDYYQSAPARRPEGPKKGKSRVLRGGSYMRSPVALRTRTRNKWVPAARANTVGFRCVIEVGRMAPGPNPTPK